MLIHKVSAYESASYGMFQILGYNYQLCGFISVFAFVEAMFKSERDHLFAFCSYIKNRKYKGQSLLSYLFNLDFESFAVAYNGPRHEENRYVPRMIGEYENLRSRR